MQASIIFDSHTGHTATAADFIAEGIRTADELEVRTFNIEDINADFPNASTFIRASDLVIFGSPTYMASITGKMKLWLEQNGSKLSLAGKLGGAFATEQYIHGGAETTLQILLTHELVYGMMTYSSGNSCGKPVIHLGPVGMRQNIGTVHELFKIYGERIVAQLLKLKA